jgi:hypothetical protein
MRRPATLARSVALALEFSGFGPAVAEGRMGLLVRVAKPGSTPGHLDFHLKLTPRGDVIGFESPWVYQNDLPPVVKATLTIVSEVVVAFGGVPFFEAQVEEAFSSRVLRTRSTYLWMIPHEDPDVRERWVLNEFHVRGERVWCRVDRAPYDSICYEAFYEHIGAMVIDFKARGRFPEGIRASHLDGFIRQCVG